MNKIIAASMVILAAGCLDMEQPEHDESGQRMPSVDAQEYNAGTLLAVAEPADGYTVRFFETEPGVVMIAESVAVDVADADVIDALRRDRPGTVVELYRAITPSEQQSDADMDELGAADARIAKRNQSLGSRQLEPRSTAEPPHVAYSGSPDYYGDNYGAQWFLDRYCTQENFRLCPTNRRWVTARSYSYSYRTCVMAADFWDGARFKGNRWNSRTNYWEPQFDLPVSPRRIECRSFYGWDTRTSYGEGYGSVPRIHFSAMSNRTVHDMPGLRL